LPFAGRYTDAADRSGLAGIKCTVTVIPDVVQPDATRDQVVLAFVPNPFPPVE
jgi:hypothetical protein